MASKILYLQAPSTLEELRSIFHYDPNTGAWKRLKGPFGRGKPGGECGKFLRGYRIIGIRYKHYKASRLAWFYMTGVWPEKNIDHIDGNPSNDRWDNLREANQTQNNANQRLSKKNKCGFKCVRYRERTGKYLSQIMIRRKSVHIGTFDTPEEAHAAYMERAIKEWGEFARSR